MQTIENPPLAHSLQRWKAEHRDNAQAAMQFADAFAREFNDLKQLDISHNLQFLTASEIQLYNEKWVQVKVDAPEAQKIDYLGCRYALSVFNHICGSLPEGEMREEFRQFLFKVNEEHQSQLANDSQAMEIDKVVSSSAELEVPLPQQTRGFLAKQEEQNGVIRFVHVSNKPTEQSPGVFRTDPQSLIILAGLKNLYQMQLPKMPREYIARLVLDRNHESIAIVKRPLKVVGGITFRTFHQPAYPEHYDAMKYKNESFNDFMNRNRGFGEIVFCAITSNEQVKGYGSHLMNHVKSFVRKRYGIYHFLTYADNYAIGYFKKQGFTADVTLDRSIWAGFIKDYQGGTIMQCTMLPRVEYLEVRELIELQKKAIEDRIQDVAQDKSKVFPGLAIFKEKNVRELDPFEIPGLIESGWNPGMEKEVEENNPVYPLLRQLLSDLQAQSIAWPFMEPVDAVTVPHYYEVIKQPMDLRTMEHRLEHNYYKSLDQFCKDFDLIIANCKAFNDIKSVYVKCANKLDGIFKARLKEVEEAKIHSSIVT